MIVNRYWRRYVRIFWLKRLGMDYRRLMIRYTQSRPRPQSNTEGGELVECDCGQREIEYAEIQRILDEPWPDPFAIDASEKL